MSGWKVIQGDCLDFLRTLPAGSVDAVVTDPPYGMNLRSGMGGAMGDLQITNDHSLEARDAALAMLAGMNIPILVFGRWSLPKPAGTKMVLIWEKGNHVGMGDLSLPWKPNTEEIYVMGSGFSGHRGSSVLRHLAIAGCVGNDNTGIRNHPTEKPVGLMIELLNKLPRGCTVLDPFCGSGTTGVASIKTGRNFIGCEIDPEYAETARRRCREAEESIALFTGAST